MLDEKKIQKIIIHEFVRPSNRKHKIAIPNAFYYKWESDLLTVDDDDLIHEFEIKCSRFDYLNDSKKTEKHKALNGDFDLAMIPNYFWYVHPEEINIDEVQEFAGHIIVIKRGMNYQISILKKAPQLHNIPIDRDAWQELAKKLFYKLYYNNY